MDSMNKITPELIASIAQRLYSEIPGASLVPKTEADAPQVISEAGNLPGVPAEVTSGNGTMPAAPNGLNLPSDVPGMPPSQGIPSASGAAPDHISLQGFSGLSPSWPGSTEGAGNSAETISIPGAAGLGPQGYTIPNFKGIISDTGDIPGLSGLSPSLPGFPAVKPTTPNGVTLPAEAPGISLPGQGIPSASGASPDHFSLQGLSGMGPSWPGSPGNSILSPKAVPADTVVGIPGLSGISPSWSGIPAETPTTRESVTSPDAAANSPGGLSAFVQKVREGKISDEDGTRRAGHDPDLLQRIFAKSAPDTGPRPLDIPTIRKDFPALNQNVHGKQLVWFDNGATTQKPQSVIDAVSRFYENDNSNIHRGSHTLAARATDAFELARQKVQSFLGASSSTEIIFVRGTTEGINLVAQTYGRKFLKPGDEIILSALEHHANIVPWQIIAQEKGAVIRVIPVNDRGEVMLEAYEALLGPRTKIVALTQASNSLGTILPVAEMTRAAKRYNARVLIDGAQSVSHMPVNMQEIGCDFFTFSGHKIFGPTGIGAVYIHKPLHDILPPWQGGGNMIENVTFEETTYNVSPAKFEAGTPNIADAIGLGAALDYVNRLGLVNTGRYEHELLEYATEQLSRIDAVRIIGSAREKVAVISFVVKDRKTEEVGRLLDLEGIAVRAGHHCAQPSLRRFGVEASVRPSFAFYNTFDEIDRLTDAVKKIAQN